ncbi:MAG TPA: protein kinase [Pirellulaceae bacterium]|nr:protein kinase [Pirellulaceae bacterium]HMO90597.1 protein kinase [Pirellulaceae bacterium]HMP67824.1 protein kinase [Pirellulaceae bacterium]
MAPKPNVENSKSNRTQLQSTEEILRSKTLSEDESKPPSDVPGYSIHRLLGSGAYGEVWLGIDQTTGRQVAIKFYTRKHSLDFTMLAREVEKLVYLAANRYVVQLLDVGWNAEPPYYVMDYIDHGSLEDELRNRSTLPVDEAVELFEELAIGLMHLHGKGILHCDLKPGNVLLDPEKKPRLADFGQSRLSHEQAPALGTLFYMAPEQADLGAIPDARWDVYALGALMYCMLTGSPPYRDDQGADDLATCQTLESRLAYYKKLIGNAPKPTAHRKVPGVDRALADIVNRCIVPDPKQRFATVQSVIDALRQRKEAMVRRPLMLLGILGPFLVLGLMGGFAAWAYNTSITRAEADFRERAVESNRWAAMFAARAVAERIADYFEGLEYQLNSPEFVAAYKEFLSHERVQELTPLFTDPNQNDLEISNRLTQEEEQIVLAREEFVDLEVRQKLNRFVDGWLKDPKMPHANSWFVCDRNGVQVAAVWDKDTSNTLGKNWSYRSYFHQGETDWISCDESGTVRYHGTTSGSTKEHITDKKVSEVFLSRATNTWKVAFSVPIFLQNEFEGIIGVTVELGEFISFEDGDTQYAMLINGRGGMNQGMILEHPMIRDAQKNLREGEQLDERFAKRQVDFAQFKEAQNYFADPLGYDPRHRGDQQKWVAGIVPVTYKPNGTNQSGETGLFVVAVQDANTVMEPVRSLGQRLARVGTFALLTFVIVTASLTYIVFRSYRQSRRSLSRFYSPQTEASSLHELRTILAPADDLAKTSQFGS